MRLLRNFYHQQAVHVLDNSYHLLSFKLHSSFSEFLINPSRESIISYFLECVGVHTYWLRFWVYVGHLISCIVLNFCSKYTNLRIINLRKISQRLLILRILWSNIYLSLHLMKLTEPGRILCLHQELLHLRRQINDKKWEMLLLL